MNKILIDENIFDKIDTILQNRGYFIKIPKNFMNFEEDILKEIIEIENLYKLNKISYERALNMIADLFLEQYLFNGNIYIYKNNLYEHLNIIREAMIKLYKEYKEGKISEKEFLKRYMPLHVARTNLIKEIAELEQNTLDSGFGL